MTSLRGRLLAWLLGLLTVVGVLAGVFAYALDRLEVDGSLDDQLRQIALNIGDTRAPQAGNGDAVALDREDEFVVTIWDASNQARSSDPTVFLDRQATTGFADLNGSGNDWRAYTLVSPNRTVQVAQRTVVRDEFAANSAFRAVLPILALIPLSWLLVGWIVGRVLRPIHTVTSDLRARDHGNAADPIALAGVPDEIVPLVLATNDLIVRLHAQIEFRQKFISDAAHELRTPLTALRLQAGNLRGQATDAGARALIDDVERGLRRMSEAIAQMLDLARAEAPGTNRPLQPVDLRETIALAMQDVIQLANDKGIDIGLVSAAPAAVLGDATELRTLVKNLIDNAVRYTPPAGIVDLDLRTEGEKIILEVSDTGPGVPDALFEKLFERFFRTAAADAGGSGLGLAIVRAIADRHGATVVLRNRANGAGLTAQVMFPAMRTTLEEAAGPSAETARPGRLGVGAGAE